MKKLSLFLFFVSFVFFGCSPKSGIDKTGVVTIGTFNIGWLGDGKNDKIERSEDDYKRIAQVIKDSQVDVLGLEEIENDSAVQRVLKYLPDFSAMIGKEGNQQNVGVLYRSSITVKYLGEYMPIAIEKGRQRPGFVVECKAGNFDWRMMVVHFKSTSRYDSTEEMRQKAIELRKMQSKLASEWLINQVGGKEKDILIVGDFNDFPTRKNNPSLEELINNTSGEFITKDMESCKKASWKGIDHIFASRSASTRCKRESLRSINFFNQYDEKTADKISDHCPVVVQFDVTAPDND